MITRTIKLLGTVAFGFMMILGATPPALQAEESAKPKAVFPETTFDFGTVLQGAKVTHDFVVRSEGGMDVVVQRLVPGCGCTAATAGNEPIKPGTEGRIRVEFDTAGFSGDKYKTVRVFTNDFEDSSVTLVMKGTVVPDVSIEPMILTFEDVVRGAPAEKTMQTLVIKAREGSSVRITSVKSLSKYVVINEIESSDKARKLDVGIDPSAPRGELRDRLVIGLSGARESSVNVPVYAQVRGVVSIDPAQVSFGVIEGRQILQRSLKLDNRGPGPVEIREIGSNNPAVSATWKIIEAGRKYVIQVSVDPAKVERDLRASLDVVLTGADDVPVIISVYGTLPPRVGN